MLSVHASTAALAAVGLLLSPLHPAPAHHHARTPGCSPSASINLVADGSFETPVAPAGGFRNYGTGQSIGPWKVTSGNVDLIGSGYWQAANGVQSVDLDGSTAGAVTQTIKTVPDEQYTVTYEIAGNVDGNPPTVKTGKVLIDGQDFQNFSFNVTGKTRTNMGYVGETFAFVATGNSTTLTFQSTSGASPSGPVLDNVTVEHPPCCPCCR